MENRCLFLHSMEGADLLNSGAGATTGITEL